MSVLAFYRRHVKLLRSVVSAGLILQTALPLFGVSNAYASPPTQITYNNFQGEIAPQNSNNWTGSTISGYKEGDTVRFRVDLDSTAGTLAGHLFIGFTSDPSCRFFKFQNPTNIALDFNRTTDAIDAGAGFTASFVGLSQIGGDAVADFALTSTAALSVRLNFSLQFDTNATLCATGSSQHVQADHTSVDVKDSGHKPLPIPAAAAAPVTDITVSKLATATAALGGSVTYSITVNNLDLTPAAAVSVSDTLPAGLTPVSATYDKDPTTAGGTGSCVIASQAVSCSLGILGGNDGNLSPPEADTAVVTITATVTQNGGLCGQVLSSIAMVATTTLESNYSNNSASAPTTINPCPGVLTVIKHVTNTHGGLLAASNFNVHVENGGVDVAGSPASGSESGAAFSLNPGTYTVSEDALPGYTQTSVICDGVATSTVTMPPYGSKTCTITNSDVAPQLKVVTVVINDNGGTKQVVDFPLFVGATPVTSDTATSFNAGTYNVSQTGDPGYSASFSGDCDATGHVTLAVGDALKTCTITNNDIAPRLTVIKHVINDNGGTLTAGQTTIDITGGNVSTPSFAGSEVGTTVTLNAGDYSVDESPVGGYAKTLGADCVGTIALAQSITCTITNDDIQPRLTITKIVNNRFGGVGTVPDFLLFVNQTRVFSGVSIGIDAGTYTVSEINLLGYKGAITGDCDTSGAVTLAVGDNKLCTITNDDQPTPPPVTTTSAPLPPPADTTTSPLTTLVAPGTPPATTGGQVLGAQTENQPATTQPETAGIKPIPIINPKLYWEIGGFTSLLLLLLFWRRRRDREDEELPDIY